MTLLRDRRYCTSYCDVYLHPCHTHPNRHRDRPLRSTLQSSFKSNYRNNNQPSIVWYGACDISSCTPVKLQLHKATELHNYRNQLQLPPRHAQPKPQTWNIFTGEAVAISHSIHPSIMTREETRSAPCCLTQWLPNQSRGAVHDFKKDEDGSLWIEEGANENCV